MMDGLSNYVDTGDLITLIGLFVAVFAFLSSYLSFPKNLIAHLQNDRNEGKFAIIDYFYSIDLITAWFLVYLILCIVSTIGFLIVQTDIAWNQCNSPGLRIYLVAWLFIYVGVMVYILCFVKNVRGKNWWKYGSSEKQKRIYPVGIISVCILTINAVSLVAYAVIDLKIYFATMLANLAIFLIVMVIILARYNPLTELIKHKNLLKEE